MTPLYWSLLAALYGGLVAQLVPRAAYRLSVEPGQAWRQACPRGHPLPAGWRGWTGPARCRGCGAWYGSGSSRARVAVAAAGAGTAALCVLLVVAVGPRPELAVWLLLVPFGLLLALVDVRVRRLPDVVTVPVAAGTAALLGVAELLPGEAGSWRGALLGAGVQAGLLFSVFLIKPEGMGLGDVKLALTTGAALGWYGMGVVFTGTLAGLTLGAVVGYGRIALRRAGHRTGMPLGPYLLAGAFGGVVLGAALAGGHWP